MKSLDIFGDSFSSHHDARYSADTTWLDRLVNNYDIRNFSRSGVGAHYCINKFLELTEYSDYLLFCIPDLHRLNLEYITDKTKQLDSSLVYDTMKRLSYDFPEHIDESVLEFKDRIYQDYQSFYQMGMDKLLEPLMVQYIFSKPYEKILVWPSSGFGFSQKDIIVPEHGYVVEGSLNLISAFESRGDTDGSKVFGKDTRNNHLSKENHQVMFESVFDYFENDVTPNPRNFHMNIIEKVDNFIYDN